MKRSEFAPSSRRVRAEFTPGQVRGGPPNSFNFFLSLFLKPKTAKITVKITGRITLILLFSMGKKNRNFSRIFSCQRKGLLQGSPVVKDDFE
jgi:hypothetical protein